MHSPVQNQSAGTECRFSTDFIVQQSIIACDWQSLMTAAEQRNAFLSTVIPQNE